MYIVYILQSVTDGTFYTGMTKNLERRISEHNAGKMKYTKGHTPWKLIYFEECTSRSTAREREKYWKTGDGREKRSQLLR